MSEEVRTLVCLLDCCQCCDHVTMAVCDFELKLKAADLARNFHTDINGTTACLILPEIDDKTLGLADIGVKFLSGHHSTHSGDIISKLDDGIRAVYSHRVICEQGAQQRAQPSIKYAV